MLDVLMFDVVAQSTVALERRPPRFAGRLPR